MKRNEKHQLIYTKTDLILEMTALFFVMMTAILSVVFYFKLPDQIPTHFNRHFEPDGMGEKSSIFILTVISIFTVGIMLLSARFPTMINLPFKINPEKEVIQRNMLCRMVRIIGVCISLMLFFIMCGTASPLLGLKYTSWGWMVFTTTEVLFLTIIIYIVRIWRAGR